MAMAELLILLQHGPMFQQRLLVHAGITDSISIEGLMGLFSGRLTQTRLAACARMGVRVATVATVRLVGLCHQPL